LQEIWATRSNTYYPLVLVVFWVEHALWGLEPLPYHLVNVVLHGACAIVLWRVLRLLRVPGAWLGAALWALHPVQVESAAWVSEMNNTQSCLFYLLAIFFFFKRYDDALTAKRKNPDYDYILAIICAVLALLSKSSTVMLPVVLALCAWWRQDRWSWREAAKLAPFFLISAAVSLSTISEQKFHSGALGPEWAQTGPQRIIIAGYDVWFYLGKLVWPHPLIFIYPHWDIDASRPVEYLPVLAVAAALSGLGWFRRGPMRPVFFAFAYFVISLFPVLGFFNVYFFRFSFVADHFQYLASMGPLALAGAGITTVLGSLQKANRLLEPALDGVLLLTLGVLTWRQCAMYQDVETLYRTTIARNPACWMAHNNLGLALFQQGRQSEAMDEYEQALQIKPDYAEAHYNLGTALLQIGRVPEAIEQFEQALRIKPDYAQAHNNWGDALFQTGHLPEAIKQYEQALEIDPDYAVAHYNLGSALQQTGPLSEAIGQFEQALQMNPNNAAAHNSLGRALSQTGHGPEAVEQLKLALQIDPDFADARFNWANTLLMSGLVPEAIEQYEQALRLKPDLALAHDNLGIALQQADRLPEAIEQYQQGLLINPHDADAHDNLGRALQQTGRLPEAIAQFEQTLQINPHDAIAHNNLGIALFQNGQEPQAVEQFQEALRIKPDFTDARNNLARVQALQKTAPAKN
jgi:tetratricopeptide (TPR) repeat protein